MAKISAHGTVIGTVEYIAKSKRYMSDGTILKNIGFGWKLAGKVKDGVTPYVAYHAAADRLAAKLAEAPAMAKYIKALHSMAGIGKRWKLHAAIQLMPTDADGVWSEVCDGYGDNVSADVDEVSQLCNLYCGALQESRSKSQE